jgi:PAS domain S-box-containing protein
MPADTRTRSPRRRAPAFIPLVVGLIVAAATLVLWHQLRAHDRAEIHRIIESDLDSARREIEGRIQVRLFNLVRMAERWEIRGSTPHAEWENDSRLLIEHHPEMAAVAWVDPTFQLRWVVPTTGGWAGMNLGEDSHARAAMEEARASRTARIVATFAPDKGPALVAAVAPILSGDQFSGFIAGLFRSQDLLQMILTNVAQGLRFSISDGGKVLYLRDGLDRDLQADWSVESELTIAGARWRLKAWPSRQWLVGVESTVDELVLGGGLLLAVLLALTVYLAQTAESRWRLLARETAARSETQEKAAFLAAIVNSSGDAIVGKTTAGTIVSWNSGAEQLYGYSATEMIGRNISVLVPPDRPAELKEILDVIGRGELVDHYETVRVRKDGARVDVSITISPIRDASGAVIGASSIGHDITRRKRAEAEITRALTRLHRMEESAREQSLSLASTSHDVRGALAVIAGFAKILSEEPTADGAREMALRIDSLAHTVSDVMTDLLEHASSRGDLALRTVSARALVEKCAEDWRLQCEEKGLVFIVDPPADGLVVVDPTQLGRILHNLISNAVRYTSQGEVRVRGELTASTLRVTVEDTGIGIAPEDLERVFDQFYRTDEAKKLEQLGTGLGLATVKRLVGLSGGQVHVRSTVGKGTAFEVILPRRPPN